MTDRATSPIHQHDERLFAAFLDWWWFQQLDPLDPPMPPPQGDDLAEVAEDFRTLLAHLAKSGYSIVHSGNGSYEQEEGSG